MGDRTQRPCPGCGRIVVVGRDHRFACEAEVERLRELLRRCYCVVGPDELAREIEAAVPGV